MSLKVIANNKFFRHSLIKHSGIFLFFSFISSLVGFFVQPILSHYLSRENFGVLGLFTVTLTLFTPIIGLSVNSIIARSYNTREDISSLIGSSIIFSFSIFCVTLLLTLLVPSKYFLPTGLDKEFVVLAIIGAFAAIINAVFLVILQLQQKAFYWGIASLTGLSLNVLFTFGLLYLTSMTYQARIVGLVVSPYASALLAYYFLNKNTSVYFSFNTNHYKYFFKLGIPLIVVALSGWGLLSLDKIFIKYLLSIELVGIYYMASTLSSPMLTIITSFSRAWVAYAYKNLALGNHQSVFNVAIAIFVFFLIIASLISTVGVYIYKLIIDDNFFVSMQLVPILVFGLAFRGIYMLLAPFILHKEKTHISAYIVFICLIINALLNYLFITKFGVVGATIASLIAYLFMGLLPLLYVKRTYNLKIQSKFYIGGLKEIYYLVKK